ncbi:MAG: prolipoprotein diacylglyceryl transferase [Candidatus Omnitrophica bacterium]|nr:prolipoprotein diacylglyceryl transferase [Candidatus Omnitrophota bacterium]
MHPLLLKIGSFTVYSYGMMIALGFALATYVMYTRAAQCGFDRNKIVDMNVLLLVGGLIGGRALYVALHLPYYMRYPAEVFNFSKGGLVWYGGFFAALLVFLAYTRANKMRFWATVDFIAPYLALAQSFGRIGCFLNGCCYGIIASPDYSLAVMFPGADYPRHPTQIYSSLLLLAIFIVLRIFQDRDHFEGKIFLLYCVLYSAKRFGVEFLRADNPRILLGLTLAQVLSALLFLAALVLLINKGSRWKKSASRSR